MGYSGFGFGFGSGSGSGPSYVDPGRVFALVARGRPHDLFGYLASIPGASEDLHCILISLTGRALLDRRLRCFWPPQPDEESWTLYLAEYAWIQAADSRLCAPRMVGNPFNFASDAGQCMHPFTSSSYSGRMSTIHGPGSNVLNQLSASSSRVPDATFRPLQANSNDVLRHTAMLNRLSASSSRIPAATLPPLQTNSNDVINFPIRGAGTFNQTSAFNSGAHDSAYAPLRDNSTIALTFAQQSLGQPGSEQRAPHELMENTVSPQELEQNNRGRRATGLLSQHRPGSEQFTPRMLMQNGEVLPAADIKGRRPAAEVDQLEAKILRLNVASSIAQDGTKGAAGVLIRHFSSAQFISASCFRIPRSEPALIFATACCKGIEIAQAHQPTIIVLESHLFHLLKRLCATQMPWPEIEELTALLEQKPPHCIVRDILEESNHVACQLAICGLFTEVPKIFFDDPPHWLVLT